MTWFLFELIRHEWRILRRSPVWVIGLAGAILLAVSEAQPQSVTGWPTPNQALRGFQLAASMVLGIVMFLAAAASMARELEESRSQLLFSRPVPLALYICGKFLAAVFFGLGLAGCLAVVCLSQPSWAGEGFYDPRPFAWVLGLCVVPMLSYVCALALLLTALARRLIVVMPLYLIYFFAAALMRDHGSPTEIDLADFSMRLYPPMLGTSSPVELRDFTFGQLLHPLAPGLMERAILYLVLSMVLLAGASWVLSLRRDSGGGTARILSRVWPRRHVAASPAGKEGLR